MSDNKRIPVNDLEELLKLVKKYLLEDKSLVSRSWYKSSGTISYKNGNYDEGEIIEPMRIGVVLKKQASEEPVIDIFIPFEGYPSSPEQEELFEQLVKEMKKFPKIESPKTVVKPLSDPHLKPLEHLEPLEHLNPKEFSQRKIEVNNSAEFLAKVKELVANEKIEFFQRSCEYQEEWSKEGKFQGGWNEFSMKFRSSTGVIKIYSKNDNFDWKDSDEIELDKLLASRTNQRLFNSKINENKQKNTKKEQEIETRKETSDENLPKSSKKGLFLGISLGILVGAALMGIIIYSINRRKK